MKQQPNWQPLSMISVFHEISTGALDAAKDQLESLRNAKGRAYALDDDTVHRVIKLYTEQQQNLEFFYEQCRRWREEGPNEKQLAWVNEIEANTKEAEKLAPKILELAREYEKKTINKIMAMDEIEIMQNILSGKLDSPFK